MQFFQFAVYAPATVYYVAAGCPNATSSRDSGWLVSVAGGGLGGALGSLLGEAGSWTAAACRPRCCSAR